MAKLKSFTFISLDGYYKDVKGDISWHQHGIEESKYSEENLKAGNTLLFGRLTYEMMAGFWPTPMAREAFPEVAEGMNKARKLVISRTLQSPGWPNTEVINENFPEVLADLKRNSEKDITLLGSGSILTQLAQAKLIDEYQLMIDPVILGRGTSLFEGVTTRFNLKLVQHKVLNSGSVLLSYENNE